MDRYRSAHLAMVPRPTKVTIETVKPAYDKEENINNQLPLTPAAWTTSTQSLGLQSSSAKTKMTLNGKNYQRRHSSVSLLTSDRVKQLPKESSKDPKINSNNNKTKWSKLLLIALGIIIGLSALAALGIGIYYLIRSTETTLTTTSTMTTTTFTLRWQSTGTTVAGLGGPGGPASDRFSTPYHITLDSSNTLYVADYYNNRIQKFLTGNSIATTVAGQSSGAFGSTANDLHYPTCVLVDLNGNLFVSDSLNHRVQYFPNGTLPGTTLIGTGSNGSSINELSSPRGLARNSNSGTLYIADFGNHRILSYLSNATTVVAGGNGPGTLNTQLSSPFGLYYDSPSNSLFITNYGAHNIVRWVLGASTWTLVAGSASGTAGYTSTLLYNPTGLTLDSMGNVYVAEYVSCRIQMFMAGQLNGTTIAGVTSTAGSLSNLLYYPYSVALDGQFNLYVADSLNQRIQKFLRY